MTRKVAAAAAVSHPWSRGQVLRGVVLAAAAVMVYATALDGPFVYDDYTAILDNEQIRQLTPIVEPLSPPRDTPVAGRPLVNLSFALNYAVSGLDVRGFRITNLAIHFLAALALLGVVRRTLDREGTDPALRARSLDVAFVCALIWLLHPLQTEVVNYVTQRTTSLMGLLFLVTLYCSIRALDRPRNHWPAAAVLACAAGMACKETMAAAPLMVALYDRVFVHTSFREALGRRRRFYVALAASWLVLAALLATGPRSTIGFDAGVDPWTYLLNQAAIIVDYLRLTFVPRGLVLDYGVPRPLTLLDVLLPAVVVTGLLVATLAALVWRPRVGFLGVWFFVTLAPTSSIVPIVTEVGAERRMYLPLAAIVVLGVCAAFFMLASRRVPRRAGVAICAGVCVALAAGTALRSREYRSRLSLAETDVERRPHGRAYLRLGGLLLEAGRRPEALAYFERARRANAVGARFVLGTEHLVDGNIEAGIAELTGFIRRHPAHRNTIPARTMLGRAYMVQGRLDEAAAEFTKILDEVPNHYVAHEQMGDLRLAQDNPAAAVPHLEFIAARKADVNTLGKLGTALSAAGRADEALRALTGAIAADPNHAHARRVLGRVLAGQGRLREAIVELERAVELDPEHSPALYDLQAARAELRARQ